MVVLPQNIFAYKHRFLELECERQKQLGILDNRSRTAAAHNYAHRHLLTTLNIENNPALSGEAVDSLRISLYACEVAHSALSYMISIDGYALSNDSTYIDLSGLNIYDITNFDKFLKPETVNLARNNISNIYLFQNSPNRYLIRHLDLSYNALSDITPIASLMNLETLNLSYNMISSELPLLSLHSLRQLDVRGTLLTQMQVAIIRSTLTGCNVISDYGW